MPFAGPESALADTISPRGEGNFMRGEITRPAGGKGPSTTFQSLAPGRNDLQKKCRHAGTFCACSPLRHHSRWRQRRSKLRLYDSINSIGLLLVRGLEIQRGGIHAIAQAGRRRTVFEHMSQVRIAFGATHFSSHHAVFRVAMLNHVAGLARLVEARPSRPGIKLRLRIE